MDERDRDRRYDDGQAATRGELRRLERRVGQLSQDIDGLSREFKGVVKGMEAHVERVTHDKVEEAFKPYRKIFDKMERISEVAEKSYEIMLEQRAHQKIKTEKAEELAAKRRYRNTLLKILSPIILALIALLGAMINSRVNPSTSPPIRSGEEPHK